MAKGWKCVVCGFVSKPSEVMCEVCKIMTHPSQRNIVEYEEQPYEIDYGYLGGGLALIILAGLAGAAICYVLKP